jgi:hypothetical protein
MLLLLTLKLGNTDTYQERKQIKFQCHVFPTKLVKNTEEQTLCTCILHFFSTNTLPPHFERSICSRNLLLKYSPKWPSMLT